MKFLPALLLLVASALGQDDSFVMPYGEEAGDTVKYPSEDDVPRPVIFSLPEPLTYFGSRKSKIHLNEDGRVGFDNEQRDFVPGITWGQQNSAFIAVWWNVFKFLYGTDTPLYGRVSSSTSDVETISAVINTCEGGSSFEADQVFVATWHKLGTFYLDNGERNSFQVIIAYSGSATWALFDYQRLEWYRSYVASVSQRGFQSRDPMEIVDLGDVGSVEAMAEVLANTNCGQAGLYAYEVSGIDAGPSPSPPVEPATSSPTDPPTEPPTDTPVDAPTDPTEVGLVLMSARLNADIELIGEDAVFSRRSVGRSLTTRVEYEGEIGSVVYYINGEEYSTKNDAPYQMSNLPIRDPSNIRRVVEFADLGTYTVLAEIMSGPDGTGDLIASVEATFTIVK